ncbi:MAG: extracellular solute-binding protein [Clostridia bacterium]|nr:extracellular solute-binding protein [Clostridia bacterium]
MKKGFKFLSVMLALSLVLSLVACSGQKTTSKTDDTLTIFGNVGSTEGMSVIDEKIINGFKEKTGITVEIQTGSSSGYLEQLQLLIASGEYPDVALFPTTTVQAYIDVCEGGKVAALDEYLTEENCPNLMAYTYPSAWEGVKPLDDGKIYAVPRTSLTRNEGIIVRADWMKNIGMGNILERDFHDVSADEFKEILKRMTEDDPDNNGKDDTIGTSCWTDDVTKQFGPLEFSRGFYGDYGWYAYEGEEYDYMFPQYSLKSDIFKNQLQYTQDLYTAGYFDVDGPSMTKSAVGDEFIKQRYGVRPAFVGDLASEEEKIVDANNGIRHPEGSYVDYIFAKDENGVVAGNGYYKPMWGQWCVFTVCENPNNFIQFCDYMLSDEVWDMIANGVEGITYEMIGGIKTPIVVEPGEQGRGASFPSGIIRKAGDPEFFALRGVKPDKTAYMEEPTLHSFYIGQVTQIDGLDNGFVPEASSKTQFINAQDDLAQVITKICAGKMRVSEYDKALDAWYKAGGKDYVEQMNAYISKNQSSDSATKIEKPVQPDQWTAEYNALLEKYEQ